MDSNHTHAIIADFTMLNETDKYSFLFLTKFIIELQTQNKFNILNTQQGKYENIFRNYPSVNFTPDNYNEISQIYQKYELFLEIKKYVNKTVIIKRLSPILNKILKNKEENECFKRFINITIIVNLIKKQLKNKSPQDITNYTLLQKLHDITPNVDMVGLLNLRQLQNLGTKEQLRDYIDTVYKYRNIGIPCLTNNINEDECNKIHEIFYHFI